MGAVEILKRLSQADVDRRVLDDLVALSAEARKLHAEYMELGVDVPAWLEDSRRILVREVTSRIEDELRKRLGEISREEQGLESRDDKRARLAREREALEKRLGVPAVPQSPAPVA